MSIDANGSAADSGFDPGEVNEMRALGRLLQRSVEPDTVYDGTDSSGLVTVMVTGRGAVRDVTIDPGWVSAIGPSALGPALMEAFQAANVAALAASLQNFRAAVDTGAVAEQVAEVAAEEAVPPREETYDQLVERLEEAYRSLDRVEARVAEFQRLTSVTGKSKLLRLTLDQGSMTGITVTDPRRATQVSAYQLAAEAVSMFQAAAPPSV